LIRHLIDHPAFKSYGTYSSGFCFFKGLYKPFCLFDFRRWGCNAVL